MMNTNILHRNQVLYKEQNLNLTQFGQSLHPSPEYLTKGRAVLKKLTDKICYEGFVSIDRMRIVGSIGKKVALSDKYMPDFDVVMFVNKQDPPFKTLLENLKNLLASKMNILNSKVKTTKFSVQFSVDGMEFDLLPAVNLAVGEGKRARQRRQREETNDRILGLSDPSAQGRLYSGGLAEFAVVFMQGQSEIMHTVVKLAKLWYKLSEIKEYVSGGSAIMELVAIHANRGRRKRSVISCLFRFLICMTKFRTLKIILYYNPLAVPQKLLDQSPLILDPTNPNNNLAHGLDLPVLDKLEKAAQRTLKNLNSLTNANINIESLITPISSD